MNEDITEIIYYALKSNGLPEGTALALANYEFMKKAYYKIKEKLNDQLYKELYDEAMKFIVAQARI